MRLPRQARDDRSKGFLKEAGKPTPRTRPASGQSYRAGKSAADRPQWQSDQAAPAAQKGRVTRCLATPAP